MAFDEDLANRIRELLSTERAVAEKAPVVEKAMFGGLAFLLGGHMAVAISSKGGLMVRVPPEDTEALLTRTHVSPMVMGGREIRGWVRVADEGVKTTRQLQSWVRRGAACAGSLPPK